MPEEHSAETLSCPSCGETALDESIPGIEPICRSCGLVISENTAIPIIESLSQKETEKTLTWSEYYNVRNSTEQQIAAAFEELEEVGDRLGIGVSERERAAELYVEAAVEAATDGRPTALVIAAILVHATRLERTPRPLGCIAGAADVEVKSLSRIVRTLPEEVGFESITPIPQEYIPWLCAQLDAPPEVAPEATSIADELANEGLISGRHPVGVAAASIYMAVEGSITQRAIANIAGVTEETIRVRIADCRRGGVIE